MSITLTEGEIGLICDLLENQAENHDEWGEKHNAEWVWGLIENIKQQ